MTAKFLLQVLFFLLLQAACLFGAAGTLEWAAAWVYLGLYAANSSMLALILLRINPDLLEERSRRHAETPAWDRGLAAVMALLGPVLILIVAGLDRRVGWTEAPGLPWQGLGLALMLLGFGLTDWAMAANRFFSGVVRLQAERGHRVVSAGPYRLVRHPGYLGSILFDLGAPLLLGAPAALIPAFFTVAAIIARTALEDRTLQTLLAGYAGYSRDVRYRLLPGLW